MNRLVSAAAMILAVALFATACANKGGGDGNAILSGDPPRRATGSPGDGPDMKTGDLSADEQAAVEMAVSELQKRTGHRKEDIELGGIRPVEWSDSSLGCPRPGMSYMQVITPGYLVNLVADEQQYAVHVGRKSAVVCDSAVRGGPAGSRDAEIRRLETLAKVDLSARVGVTVSSIQRLFVRPETWPDTRLGCDDEGDDFKTVETSGFVIGLRAGGRLYTYHTDLDRVFACPDIAAE